MKECQRRRILVTAQELCAISQWAKERFNLKSLLSRITLKRIIDDASNIHERASGTTSNQKRERVSEPIIIEKSLIEWVWDVWEREIFISVVRLLHDVNSQLTSFQQIDIKFSNRWLYRLKQWNDFKICRSHREDGDADEQTI